MGRVFFYAPHPDDETLSMGLAMLHYIANGFEVHLVSMCDGSADGVANTLNGSANGTPIVCSTPADHPYIHSPAREGYPGGPLTAATVGAARILEARSALGAMAMVPPITPGVTVIGTSLSSSVSAEILVPDSVGMLFQLIPCDQPSNG